MHYLDVDSVEGHIFQDLLGLTFRHPPARLAIPGDGPAIEARGVQAPEDPGAPFDEWLDLEVFLPDASIPKVFRKAGAEQIRGLEEVSIGRNNKLFLRQRHDLPWLDSTFLIGSEHVFAVYANNVFILTNRSVQCNAVHGGKGPLRPEGARAMTERWIQRPPGSTWGDWGDGDELGRINLLTSDKVLQGVQEVEAGISFCLSLPLDYPGGTALNQRRYPPVLAPTEDMRGNPDTFYNVHMKDMDEGDDRYVDVWADDVVTLSLQYSTQWDSLAHVGAEFDADGDGIEEAVYYNGYRAGIDLVGPKPDAAGDGGNHRCFAHHLGLEHMAYHGVQGRGVLVDLVHHLGHDWRGVDRKTLEEIMAADNIVIEPGDMLLLHTGFATKILEWNRHPDPVKIHTMCTYLDARDQSLLEWITESQISALVADNNAVEGLVGRDRDQSRHSLLPIHHLCLFKLGVPLGEMWYLHELASWLRQHNRSRFLLTAPPLRLPGVVGSPLTPVATV
jgi:kynurenine formamidase